MKGYLVKECEIFTSKLLLGNTEVLKTSVF